MPWFLGMIVAAGIVTETVALSQSRQNDEAQIQAAGSQWLAVMNKDNDNTVDKKEFLDYMATQFDAADPDPDHTRTSWQRRRPGHAGLAAMPGFVFTGMGLLY